MPTPPPTKVTRRRVAAWCIDTILSWGVTLTCFLLVADKVPETTASESSSTAYLTLNGDSWLLEGSAATLFMTSALAAWLVYTGVLPGVTGWTAGKRLMGVRLVGPDGVPPGAGRGVVRSLFWVVDGFPYFLPGLVAFIVALTTQRHQRVGDQVAGTFIVRAGTVPESEARPLATDAPPSSASAGWYADPRGEQRLRYWDGEGWTADTAP
jgi:uncharacterized RDD family membrane protein YckC